MTEEEKKLLEQQNAAKTNTGYESKWQDQVDNYINQIQNRKPFEYDLNADALYQQYANQYRQQGNLAMMDTMGQAQAMTGGYGNSYAQSVGQQAYNQQLNQLNNVVPELYSMALDRYMNEGNQLYNQLNIAMQQEDIDYGRYRDQLSDQRVAQDDAYNKTIALMTGYGYNPTAEELAAAGITEAQKNAILAPYMAATSSSRKNGTPREKPLDTHGLTEEAIALLQRYYGLEPTGKMNQETENAYQKEVVRLEKLDKMSDYFASAQDNWG